MFTLEDVLNRAINSASTVKSTCTGSQVQKQGVLSYIGHNHVNACHVVFLVGIYSDEPVLRLFKESELIYRSHMNKMVYTVNILLDKADFE
jgi:hypothetical protein